MRCENWVPFLTPFAHFEKTEVGLCSRLALCISPYEPLNALVCIHVTWDRLNGVLQKPSYQSVCLHVYVPPLLLGNGQVNTVRRQRRFVSGVAFNAVSVVSKESSRLILARTSCYNLHFETIWRTTTPLRSLWGHVMKWTPLTAVEHRVQNAVLTEYGVSFSI